MTDASAVEEQWRASSRCAMATSAMVAPRPPSSSGTAIDPDGTVRTNGGRVLAVVARAEDLPGAAALADAAADRIRFQGRHRRRDIGRPAAASRAAPAPAPFPAGAAG
jgi:phosphoribosylamine-glycine ligase